MKKTSNQKIREILERGNFTEVTQLFAITDRNQHKMLAKYELWIKIFFPLMFKKKEAPFHEVIKRNLCELYLGNITSLTQIAFRGASKTTYTKLFVAFILCNDQRASRRKYLKILSADPINSTQFTTDVYNMLVSKKVKAYYPDLFMKTDQKREETMSAFTLANGIKVLASTVGREQRGHLQGEEASRPDLIIFEDFETSKTALSLAESESIWTNMEEAWNGKALGGVGIYNCNYISKRRNVQKIINRARRSPDVHRIHIVPIMDEDGNPTWASAYTIAQIKQMERDATDFQGEYMCNPSGELDSYFSEKYLMLHPNRTPILEADHWTYYAKKEKGHKYIMGIDPAGGNGGDFATIVVIDYTIRTVVAFFRSRYYNPEKLGDEACVKGKLYNNALAVPERNNHGHAVILQMKHNKYSNIYEEVDESEHVENYTEKLGVNTDAKTKPAMLSALSVAVNNFSLVIPSEVIKNEMMNFPREYVDARKTDADLGHFDLVLALAFAWQGRHQVGGDIYTSKYT